MKRTLLTLAFLSLMTQVVATEVPETQIVVTEVPETQIVVTEVSKASIMSNVSARLVAARESVSVAVGNAVTFVKGEAKTASQEPVIAAMLAFPGKVSVKCAELSGKLATLKAQVVEYMPVAQQAISQFVKNNKYTLSAAALVLGSYAAYTLYNKYTTKAVVKK